MAQDDGWEIAHKAKQTERRVSKYCPLLPDCLTCLPAVHNLCHKLCIAPTHHIPQPGGGVTDISQRHNV